MHPRVSLHQVAFLDESTTAFVDHCRTLGVANLTLVTPALMQPGGVEEALRALTGGGPRVATVNHPFAVYPDLDSDRGQATEKLNDAIDIAVTLGAAGVYLLTGARGSLTWEQAAGRFADLLAPLKEKADGLGVTLMVENASSFNADIHIAHTLTDAITLAARAGIGVCIDFHACWMEAGLGALVERAMPVAGLVQVSDYVLGDRSAPCRAVPGDGAIPLDDIIRGVLDAGYPGLFDIELVGPRIEAEGPRSATARAAQRISDILTTLGA